MNQSINHKLKLISNNNTSLSNPTQTTHKQKIKKCKECKKKRKFDEILQICHTCIKAKAVTVQSGNKVVDNFIKYTLTNRVGSKSTRMEFVPYDRFKDVEFIAEGGFSKIHKATWIDGPITEWNMIKQECDRYGRMTVALKELSNSKNIDPKELNELKIFYDFTLKEYQYVDNIHNINRYYGITQQPITQNFMIITKYYEKGDLAHYITSDFFKIPWENKLNKLRDIAYALKNMHEKDIIHKDYHSGNIFISDSSEAITGDLGLSKSATESDNDDEIYGIIPYIAPEIFQGQKYTTASDIYSYGMIMWELMTGRRPFWDQSHDTDLIIKICDGLRPPIVTNAPKGYIEFMQKCWHPNPEKRPAACEIDYIFWVYGTMGVNERENPTKIIESPDIGPITNNPDAIYKSRPLSTMIKSADIGSLYYNQNNNDDKRKFDDNDKDKITKKIKLFENNNNDYLTKEFGFDIDSNINFCETSNNEYLTKELGFDIDSNINFCESRNNEYLIKEFGSDVNSNINFCETSNNEYLSKELGFDINSNMNFCETSNNEYLTQELWFDIDSNINFCEPSNNEYLIKEFGSDVNSNINFCETSNNEYLTKEFGFDIDSNINFCESSNNDYTTKEIGFDI